MHHGCRMELTWVEGDGHVWQLCSQAHTLSRCHIGYERMVCPNEAFPLRPMTKIDLVLVSDHLHRRWD